MAKSAKCSICQTTLVEGYCPYHDTDYMMVMIEKKIECLNNLIKSQEDELVSSRKIIKQLSDKWKDWKNRVLKLDKYDGERWDHPMNHPWVSQVCEDSCSVVNSHEKKG